MELITVLKSIVLFPLILGVVFGYLIKGKTKILETLSNIIIIGFAFAVVVQIILVLVIGYYLPLEAHLVGVSDFLVGLVGNIVFIVIIVYTFIFGISFTIGALIGDLIEKITSK